jgi:hypothetical protein
MTYTVGSYENTEIPRLVRDATFETEAEALACAHRVIRGSLEVLFRDNKHRDPSALGLLTLYLSRGLVPWIFGEPEASFDVCRAIDWHIRRITGRSLGVQ